MKLQFHSVTDDEKCLDKTLDALPLELEGALRKDADILNPIIMVASNVTEYNYVYIPEFHRYYWITSVNQYRRGLWIVRMKVDVLMTYSEQIKELSGVVDRYDGASPYAAKNLIKDVRKKLRQIDWNYTFQIGSKVLIARRGG